jgi:hypothetical protein
VCIIVAAMSTPGGDSEQPESHAGERVAPRDLVDFYRRWPDFRRTVAPLAERPDLSALERQTIHWLILLVDRISEHDLQPGKRL